MQGDEQAVDAAFVFNSLALNGGLEQAFEVDGALSELAIQGFEIVGRSDLATLLATFVDVVAPDGIPSEFDDRTRLLQRVDGDQRVTALSESYDAADDPQPQLEAW